MITWKVLTSNSVAIEYKAMVIAIWVLVISACVIYTVVKNRHYLNKDLSQFDIPINDPIKTITSKAIKPSINKGLSFDCSIAMSKKPANILSKIKPTITATTIERIADKISHLSIRYYRRLFLMKSTTREQNP